MSKHALVTAAQNLRQRVTNGASVSFPTFKGVADKFLSEQNPNVLSAAGSDLLYIACDSGLAENHSSYDFVTSIIKKCEALNKTGDLNGSTAAACLFTSGLQKNLSAKAADDFLFTMGKHEMDVCKEDQKRMNLMRYIWDLDVSQLSSVSKNVLQLLVVSADAKPDLPVVKIHAKNSWMNQSFVSPLEESVGNVLHQMEVIFDSAPMHYGAIPITLRSRPQRRIFLIDTPNNFFVDSPNTRLPSHAWQLRALAKSGWKINRIGTAEEWGNISTERDKDQHGKPMQPTLSQQIMTARKDLISNALNYNYKV